METTREQSEFNMAVSYLNRLNFILYSINIAKGELDVHTWFHECIKLFCELSTEMTPEEKDKFTKTQVKLNNRVMEQVQDNVANNEQNIEFSLYMELQDYELSLRMILKDSGMQAKMKDDFLAPEREW